MTRRHWLSAAIAGAASAVQRGTNVGRRIPPVDQAGRDPKLAAFRGALLAAASRRDAAWVRAHLTAAPVSSFDAERTVEGFARAWELDRGAESAFWKTLATVLRAGGAFLGDGRFASPYYYAAFPEDIDANEYEVVVKAGAPLRAAPEPAAAVVEVLRWDIVEVQAFDDEPWRYVRSASGKLGYVERPALRSPLGPRAILAKTPAGWRLDSLVAGD